MNSTEEKLDLLFRLKIEINTDRKNSTKNWHIKYYLDV